MRPLRLVMQAFGPYAAIETIDFSQLHDNTLFLIHGKTGAGKSSILEAICFALYGDKGAGEKALPQLRSHFADNKLRTLVTLDFSLGNKSYRVSRMPTQKLEGRKTEIKHSATLWDISNNDKHTEEGQVIAEKASDVNEYIRNRIGFDAEQFRQVVVLPQGEFKKLLTADSQEKEAILSRLFRTEHYKQIEEKLKDILSKQRKVVEGLHIKQASLIEHYEVESAEELKERLENDKFLSQELTKQINAYQSDSEKIQNELESIRESNRRFEEYQNASASLKQIEQNDQYIEDLMKILKKLQAAERLSDIYQRLKDQQQVLTEQQDNLEQSKEQLRLANKTLRDKTTQLEELENTPNEIKQLNSSLKMLESYQDSVNKLAEEDKILSEFRKSRIEQEATLETLLANILELEKTIEQLRGKAEETKGLSAKESGLKMQYEATTKHIEYKKELVTVTTDLKKIKSIVSKLEQDKYTNQQKLKDLQNKLADMEGVWENEQAAVLAKNLEDNVPCPVCGSVHHPKPAKSKAELPSYDEIKQLKLEIEQTNKTLSDNDKLSAQQQTQAAYQERAENLANQLIEVKDESIQALETSAKAIKLELDNIEKAVSTLDKLEATITDNKKERDNLIKEKETLEKSLNNIKDEYNQQLGTVNRIMIDIPEEYREKANLLHQMYKTANQINQMESSFAKAKKEFEDAKKVFESTEFTTQSFTKRFDEESTTFEKVKSEFSNRLNNEGFASFDEFQQVNYKIAEREELENTIDQHLKSKNSAAERSIRAKRNLEKEELQSTNLIEDKLDSVDQEIKEKLNKQGELNSTIKNLDGTLKDLNKLAGRIASQEEKYSLIKSVADVASGKNRDNLAFNRYILTSFLEEVLIHASMKLRQMSRGRYDLNISKDQSDRRKASGLELEVSDSHTGTLRSVKTLSGGETFLASLALALGLSEVVQNYAGGIKLDTIFIDEGFGTLDPESLDLAFKTLLQIKQGKLVGIISHVPELKEYIDTRLEIRNSKNGSKTIFHI